MSVSLDNLLWSALNEPGSIFILPRKFYPKSNEEWVRILSELLKKSETLICEQPKQIEIDCSGFGVDWGGVEKRLTEVLVECKYSTRYIQMKNVVLVFGSWKYPGNPDVLIDISLPTDTSIEEMRDRSKSFVGFC
jgi:hypothetical protein